MTGDAHSQTPPADEPIHRGRHRAEEGAEQVLLGRKRLLVTGSRDWWNQPAIAAAILRAWIGWGRPPLTLVHGGAGGADLLAASVIDEQKATAPAGFFKTEAHPALWDVHGKAAGFIRNAEMVSLGADLCLAFWRNQSKGTANTIELCERAGIPLLVYREDGDLPSS